MCSDEGLKSESNRVNWVKYEMIRYKTNNNINFSNKLQNIVENDDIWVMNGK